MTGPAVESPSLPDPLTTRVSVGICTHNEGNRVNRLLESLESQTIPESFTLEEILVVASGCTDNTESIVGRWRQRDPRICLLVEPERKGKASAVNQVLRHYRGDILVLVNGDAFPMPGALAELLRPFAEQLTIRLACAAPFPERGTGLVQSANELLWALHNRTLSAVADLGVPNHCCDEMLAVRRGVIDSLPPALVNDGAYLGALAAKHELTVYFSRSAFVLVTTPRTVRELLEQRQRILRGHRQVRELLGRRSPTLEGLLRDRTGLVMRILRAAIRERPSRIFPLLFLAIPIEALAHQLAWADGLRKREYPAIWRRVEISS